MFQLERSFVPNCELIPHTLIYTYVHMFGPISRPRCGLKVHHQIKNQKQKNQKPTKNKKKKTAQRKKRLIIRANNITLEFFSGISCWKCVSSSDR